MTDGPPSGSQINSAVVFFERPQKSHAAEATTLQPHNSDAMNARKADQRGRDEHVPVSNPDAVCCSSCAC